MIDIFRSERYESVYYPLSGSKKCNEIIKNLEGTKLNLFCQIQFAGNYNKWEIVIILFRILIMHIAKDKDADEKDITNFKTAIQFLNNKKVINDIFIQLLDNIRIQGTILIIIIQLFLMRK